MSEYNRFLQVAVVTPEGSAFEGPAQRLSVPAFDGEMTFLPMHAPLVAVLGYGELRVTRPDGATERFYLGGGVVQVAADDVAILAESVVRPERLDSGAAEEALKEALAAPARGDAEIDARQRRQDDARARMRVAARS